MAKSVVKYIYDEIEEALFMCEKIRLLYLKEKMYLTHSLYLTKNNRFLIIFTIDGSISTNLH